MPNAELLTAEVEAIDLEAKRVKTSNGTLPYNYIILAPGWYPRTESGPSLAG